MIAAGMSEFPVIHAVTDSAAVMRDGFVERASSVMRALGRRGALHLRSSRASGRKLHELAAILAEVQRESGCWLIVNDRVDIAAAVHSFGVQLASHSLRIGEAQLVAPRIPVGASVHSVQEAVDAQEAGAAWCVAGTVFETPSHSGRAPGRVELIERIAKAVSIPVIAIGGIGPEDIAALRSAGAHGVATIRGVGWDRAGEAATGEDDLLKTRLPVSADPGFAEPVTRYISAYDADSAGGRDDHPGGERSAPGAGT
jgi:thiazole tautomerase (transcriptional regulator TenI)